LQIGREERKKKFGSRTKWEKIPGGKEKAGESDLNHRTTKRSGRKFGRDSLMSHIGGEGWEEKRARGALYQVLEGAILSLLHEKGGEGEGGRSDL